VTAGQKAVKVVDGTHEYVELVPDEDDFLSYWASRPGKPAETKTIIGVAVKVPHDVPLRFNDDVAERIGSSDPDSVKFLLEGLFGSDPLEQWVANGATGEQLQVILAWGMANGQGQPTTFAEAAEIVEKARERDAAGKAPVPLNRAARRASSRTRASGRTGR
jgi:hypothetical protein